MFTEIVWWEIETPDPDTFQHFHSAMWGWTFQRAFEDSELDAEYWIIRAAGQGIGGLQRATTDGRPHTGVRLYLQVDDLERALEDAVAHGARVERSRTGLGGDDRWYGTILDPAGISLGLWTANPRRWSLDR